MSYAFREPFLEEVLDPIVGWGSQVEDRTPKRSGVLLIMQIWQRSGDQLEDKLFEVGGKITVHPWVLLPNSGTSLQTKGQEFSENPYPLISLLGRASGT